MSDKTSVQAVNKNRKKKLALEKSLIQALVLLWREMDDELSNDYMAAAYEVSATYENLKPPRYELMGLSSYIGMIAHLRSRYDNFTDSAAETIAGYQQQAYHLGISGAQEALDELELDDDWYRMPATEMDSRTGVSSNGIRIGDILRNGMNHVVAGLTSALIAGATFGKTPEQIVLDMKQSATSGLNQAITTGRTEYNRAHREALTEQYRQSGAIAGFRRMAYKPTACFACLMLDGEWLEKESDLEDHPNGRCMAVPFRSKDDPIPWMTGADWFLAQDAEKQMRILGKGRYEAWKAGEIPSLRDIVYVKQNETWGGCPTVRTLKELGISRLTVHDLALRGVKVDLSAITKIEDYSSAVRYAKEVLEIPYVDFTGLDIGTVREMLTSATYFKNNYPEVMREVRFFGESNRRLEILQDEIAKADIRNGKTKEKAYQHAEEILRRIAINPNSAASFYGISGNRITSNYSGITVNKNIVSDSNNFIEMLRKQITNKLLPIGNDSIKAVVDHEFGHALDEMMNLAAKRSIINKKKSIRSVMNSLSYNGTVNTHEFIADCVMEALNNPRPRTAAREIWRLINDIYDGYRGN